ncbi:MAG: TetR/AcrR family transcriptional regulator, partial [Oscillospiraceae bacterium]|nr:TetR/AcrR family transcriptional regulator [Oscillospiraceae bacterium]
MKTDLRIQKTRATVRNALFDLLGEKELSKISISELCRRAQINRKTFYRHYRSTADIIEELENSLLGELSAILRIGNNSIFDVGAVFHDISAAIEKNRELLIKVMRLNPELLTGGKIKAMMCRATSLSLKSAGTISDSAADVAAEFAVSGV